MSSPTTVKSVVIRNINHLQSDNGTLSFPESLLMVYAYGGVLTFTNGSATHKVSRLTPTASATEDLRQEIFNFFLFEGEYAPLTVKVG